MKKTAGAALAAALFLFSVLAGMAQAQEVTLRSQDGTIALTGPLMGFDGRFYRIETFYGELTADAQLLTCEGAACPTPDTHVPQLRISGSAGAAGRLLPPLVQAFGAQNALSVLQVTEGDGRLRFDLFREGRSQPELRIRLHQASTAEAFADVIARDAGAVLAARAASPEEWAHLAGSGAPRLHSRIIAYDALRVLVHEEAPLRDMPRDTLRRILTGEITSWAALGGPDAPIALHVPAADTALSAVLGTAMQLAAPVPGAVYHSDDAGLAAAVRADPLALGLGGLGATPARAVPLSLGCGIQAGATPAGLRSGAYPLAAPVRLYLPGYRLPPLARQFAEFLTGPYAGVIVRRSGYVAPQLDPAGAEEEGARLQGALRAAGPGQLRRLQSLARRTEGYARLPVPLAIDPQTGRLRPEAEDSWRRLLHIAREGAYAGRALLFAGFSDLAAADAESAPGQAAAQALMQEFAQRVPAARRAGTDLSAHGFGNAVPLDCGAAPLAANNRVEIWLR